MMFAPALRLSTPRLVLMLLLMLATVSSAWAREMVSAARDGTMLRAGPGTKHEARWSVDRGYPLEVLRRQGGWLQVRDFEGDRSWVARSVTTRQRHVVSTAGRLNIRATASLKARIVAVAEYGEVLRVTGSQGDWLKVRSSHGRVGWVSKKLTWGY
ncbi:SH3 domain-containing protein [Pseudacidovorax intermedius]|uniref:SH3 domain-containing protein n=1 Tax=Pseudacidovorax intermedius TaxID=433924 RepID=A0A370FIT5_9BURK|nr:SH3 domain-containing protein [Pseudacidovorax intermedius]RDI25029.1 SH3 domain-containing protein [Pseudacidovorax intermedius]